MALYPSNSSNLEQLALKGLINLDNPVYDRLVYLEYYSFVVFQCH